jgi:hypothetical protein
MSQMARHKAATLDKQVRILYGARMYFDFSSALSPTLEVDDIVSENNFNGEHGSGSVRYYVEDGEVVTVLSGVKAIEALRPIFEQLGADMNPMPDDEPPKHIGVVPRVVGHAFLVPPV